MESVGENDCAGSISAFKRGAQNVVKFIYLIEIRPHEARIGSNPQQAATVVVKPELKHEFRCMCNRRPCT
jgi:hypothetical protein